MALVDRNRQIPGSLKFYQPETRWSPSPWSSFNSIVDQVIAHRQANPWLTREKNRSIDRGAVEAEVDEFNSAICRQMGWNEFIVEGGASANPTPFPLSPHNLGRNVRQVAAGGAVLVEWIREGAEAVPAELATKRAAVCAACSLNEKGDWTAWFTTPISEAIRQELSRRKSMNLSTPFDAQLKVCGACLCPLPLKVHLSIDRILSKLPQESFNDLAPNCWIRSEKP